MNTSSELQQQERALDQSIEAHRELLKALTTITELRGEVYKLKRENSRLKETLGRIRPDLELPFMVKASAQVFEDARESLGG